MLARKQNLLEPGARDFSSEAHKITIGSKESRKHTNRGDGVITSSRNLKSQISNHSIESDVNQVSAVSEFKPTLV